MFTPPGESGEWNVNVSAISTESDGSMASSNTDFTITVPETPAAAAMFLMDSGNGDSWNAFLSDEMASSGNSGDVSPDEELMALGGEGSGSEGSDSDADGGGLDAGDMSGSGDLILPDNPSDAGAGDMVG